MQIGRARGLSAGLSCTKSEDLANLPDQESPHTTRALSRSGLQMAGEAPFPHPPYVVFAHADRTRRMTVVDRVGETVEMGVVASVPEAKVLRGMSSMAVVRAQAGVGKLH